MHLTCGGSSPPNNVQAEGVDSTPQGGGWAEEQNSRKGMCPQREKSFSMRVKLFRDKIMLKYVFLLLLVVGFFF